MVGGQLGSLPIWSAQYLEMSRLARKCYVELNRGTSVAQPLTAEEYGKFCPDAHPSITPGQARAIRRLLGGVPGSHDFFRIRGIPGQGAGDGAVSAATDQKPAPWA
jgi:hypothetical protein